VNDLDVIAALATPVGKSALAIIRVSGKESHKIVSKCIKEADKFLSASFNYIYRYNFVDNKRNEIIDDITAIKYGNSKSYTGEDMVEIFSHGNKIIINEILNELTKNGARLAGKGEFTRRAFLNGKIDLIKAESIHQIIDSSNEIQKRICNNVKENKYEEIINSWKQDIQTLLVEIETEIEFSEDVAVEHKNYEMVDNIINKILKEKSLWDSIRVLNKSQKIVIAGPANAGKSSLFNTLVGYNRAIVTDIPGTTRDTISETIIIENNEIELIDSAGIRDTENKIEIEGITRTIQEIEDASIVLWINSVDQNRIEPDERLREKVIKINNKIDINNGKNDTENDEINISIEMGINIDKVYEAIKERIITINHAEIPSLIANERHYQITETMLNYLKDVIEYWNEKEKASYFLYKVLEEFEELLGKRDREEIYNSIFDKFCIGK
jgi:tRNA modification GTPase